VSARAVDVSRKQPGAAEFPADTAGALERALRAQALADIARKHHGSLLRVLTQRTGSVEEAKEIAQEAYVKVLAVERRDGIASLDGYLWRSALNLVTDRARRRAVRERFSRAVRSEAEPLAPSAETVVDARQRLEVIELAVGQLPPRCLDAFILRVVQGRPFDDVGREMGISARMAKVYVARALRSLRTRLEESDSAGKV
jgi:RNA polymerase sigma-70 factor (ECF subfamily)